MNETSLQAYWEGRTSKQFTRLAIRVLDNLNVYGPCTRAELVPRTGMQLSSVCGRVRELLDLKVIEEFDKVIDTSTNKRVWRLRVKESACGM